MNQEKLHEVQLFVLKLLIAGLVFQAVLFLSPSTHQIQAAFASLMAHLLTLSGIELTHQGIRIFTSEAVYVVVQDCLGWKSMAVFVALIWASTKRTLEHLNFIIIGLVFLIIANIVRVFTTIYLAEAGLVSFDIIHDFFWRWSLTVIVLVMWFFWLKNFRDQRKFEQKIEEQVSKLKN